MHLTSTEGYHPAIAVAHEVRRIIDDHCSYLDTEEVWVAENFGITEADTHEYYFGLFTPPTLLIGADMIGFVPFDEIVDILLPGDEEALFSGLRAYLTRHLKLASLLIDMTALEPMVSAEPIYAHCKFEVYSDDFWFLAGIEASHHVYTNLARLFEEPNGI